MFKAIPFIFSAKPHNFLKKIAHLKGKAVWDRKGLAQTSANAQVYLRTYFQAIV